MKRLTEKMCNGEYLHGEASDYSTEICLEKLGQLEDIEEELGIDLLTLFKALKNGVFVKNRKGIEFAKNVYMTKYGLDCVVYYNNNIRSYKKNKLFKDYGKTWALTKEELINEIH